MSKKIKGNPELTPVITTVKGKDGKTYRSIRYKRLQKHANIGFDIGPGTGSPREKEMGHFYDISHENQAKMTSHVARISSNVINSLIPEAKISDFKIASGGYGRFGTTACGNIHLNGKATAVVAAAALLGYALQQTEMAIVHPSKSDVEAKEGFAITAHDKDLHDPKLANKVWDAMLEKAKFLDDYGFGPIYDGGKKGLMIGNHKEPWSLKQHEELLDGILHAQKVSGVQMNYKFSGSHEAKFQMLSNFWDEGGQHNGELHKKEYVKAIRDLRGKKAGTDEEIKKELESATKRIVRAQKTAFDRWGKVKKK